MQAKVVQAFFERVASDWDTMRLAYYDERVIERMHEVSDLTDVMTVADVGTGTGFVAVGVAPRVGSVIALDNSPAMLDVARKNLNALGIGNVELRLGEITALPLPSDSLDAAFANMVLHHAEDPEAMLREMARVVKIGGAVVITDEVEHPYAWMREEHADVWLGFGKGQVEGFFREAGLTRYGYESLGMQVPIRRALSAQVPQVQRSASLASPPFGQHSTRRRGYKVTSTRVAARSTC